VTWPFWSDPGDLATWVTALIALLAASFALVPFVRDSRDRVRAQARELLVYSQTYDSIGEVTGADGRAFVDPFEVSLINKTERLIFRPVIVWTGRRWSILRFLRSRGWRGGLLIAKTRRMTRDAFGLRPDPDDSRSSDIVWPGDHIAALLPSDQVEARKLTGREPWVLFRDANGRRWLLSVDRGKLKRVWPWQGPLGPEANKARPHASLLPPDALRKLHASGHLLLPGDRDQETPGSASRG